MGRDLRRSAASRCATLGVTATAGEFQDLAQTCEILSSLRKRLISGTFCLECHLMQIKEVPMSYARKDLADIVAAPDDIELALRALARESGAFRTIMKTHNQRLYRLARGLVRDNGEAEDIVQESYVRAFTHLDGFRGDSTLATWLSRIVINEALGRLRKTRRAGRFVATDDPRQQAEIIPFPLNASTDDPERSMAQRQILQLVERCDGQTSGRVPDGLRRAGHRRDEHRRDGEPARPATRDCQDEAAPRPFACAQGTRCTNRACPSRCISLCRTALRTPDSRCDDTAGLSD